MIQKRNFLVVFILGQILAQSCLPVILAQKANSLDVDGLPYPLRSKAQKPIQMDKKNQSLEDIINRTDIPYAYSQPIPLQGINISGLNSKSIQTLGENYFVVLSNSHAESMTDLYRENRANGKANFVTVDCVLHPYIAFANRVYADLAKNNLLPMMKNLMAAMLPVALSDYKQADDADVRSDIEANIAFLSVGMKILDPEFSVPQIAAVPALVQVDYDAIMAGNPGRSAIFGAEQDYRIYQVQGFYRTSPELAKFYRLKTWLSQLAYPINDVSFTNDTGHVNANNFRRSVLLYRSLDLATVEGKPAFDYWMRLVKGLFILGSQVENGQEKNVWAHDYKSVFRTNSKDLKVSLSALTEPLYRTKLLLAVRRQKPLSVGAASIFDIEDGTSGKDSAAKFRLLPNIGSPEEPWLRAMAKNYPASNENGQICPLGLIDLNAWGSAQAGNVLLDTAWALDPNLPRYLAELRKWVMKRAPGGQMQAIDNRVWGLVAAQFRLLPDGIQSVVRNESWASRRMESALCAWLDTALAILPEAHVIGTNKNPQLKSLDSNSNPVRKTMKPAAARRAARGHFLDPCPDAFQKLQSDVLRIQRETQALGFSLEAHKKGLDDFQRLFQRLELIAQQEAKGEPLAPADMNLLSNFDYVLERIDLPLPGVISFPGEASSTTDNAPNDKSVGGVNLCLGQPGLLYVVLQNRLTKEWTLARGAVYTYYELPGPAINAEQLVNKINHGQIHAPFWTERFDMVQTGK